MGCVLGVICLPITHCIGFTTSGVAVGSCAAGWQSCIGSVSAGSCFAGCQSAAAASSPCCCPCVCLCYLIILIVVVALWFFGVHLPWISDDSNSGDFNGTNTTTEGPLTMILTGGKGFGNLTVLP